jgi:hypothetical protein
MPPHIFDDSIDKHKDYGLKGLSSLWVRQTDCDAREHQHVEAQIVLPFNATPLHLHAQGQTTANGPGMLRSGLACVVDFRQPHRLRWRGEGNFANLYITEEWLEATGSGALFLHPRPEWRDPLVRELSLHIRNEYAAFGRLEAAQVEYCAGLIALRLATEQCVIERLLPGNKRSLLSKRSLQPAIDLMHDRISEPVTVAMMARS